MKSLEEVLKSNRTPALFAGFAMKEELGHSHDKNAREILKIAIERGTLYSTDVKNGPLASIAEGIINNGFVEFLESSSMIKRVQGLLCMPILMSKNLSEAFIIPRIGVARFGSIAQTGYMYPRRIRQEVKKRLQKAVNWIVESGQSYKFQTDIVLQFESFPFVRREPLVYCLDIMNRKKETQQLKVVFQLSFMLFIMKASSLWFMLALFNLILEKFIGNRKP